MYFGVKLSRHVKDPASSAVSTGEEGSVPPLLIPLSRKVKTMNKLNAFKNNSNCNPNHDDPTQSPQPLAGLQSLEERVLMSASPVGPSPDLSTDILSIDLTAGAITIDGTSHANDVTVKNVIIRGRSYVEVTATDEHPTNPSDKVKRYSASSVDKIYFYGGDGEDTFLNLTDVRSYAYGDGGNDTLTGGSGVDRLEGGSGDDVIFGKSGDDTLLGKSGADTISGGSGIDYIWGNSGADEIEGGSWGDKLFGGSGKDILWGLSGGDSLDGGSGNDQLLGGSGNDYLWGKSGKDGLYGGSGKDHLEGGNDSDRYLLDKDPGDVFIEDIIKGFDSGDLKIYFRDGVQTTSNGNRWAGASWTSSDVQVVDQAFQRLHDIRSNLLETAHGTSLTFVRQSTNLDNPGSTVNGWNGSTGTITLTQGAFNGSDEWAQRVTIHEIGHNWEDEHTRWDEFMDISNWTMRVGSALDPVFTDTHNISNDGDWYYIDNGFARGYGKTDPYEDFATSFAAYIMGSEYPYVGEGVLTMNNAKVEFMEQFVG